MEGKEGFPVLNIKSFQAKVFLLNIYTQSWTQWHVPVALTTVEITVQGIINLGVSGHLGLGNENLSQKEDNSKQNKQNTCAEKVANNASE